MARSGKLLASGIAAIILIGALIGYFVTRPYATLMAIRDAVETNNYPVLNRLVDFPSLRASVKAGLSRDLESRIGPPSSPGAQIGAMLGNMLISPMVDLMVSPLGLGFVLKGYSAGDAIFNSRSRQEQKAGPEPAEGISYQTRWESLSRYAVIVTKNGTPVSTLMLHRHGLFGWKLAAIELASQREQAGQAAPAPTTTR